MHVASDPCFRGREHAHANHDVLEPVLSGTLCRAVQTKLKQADKLKSHLRRPLSLSLLNHLRNEAEFVANPKPI